MKKIAYHAGVLYYRSAQSILKLSLEGEILEEQCDAQFLRPSALESELSDPSSMALGVIGEGCGGNHVFICDTTNNQIIAHNLENGEDKTILSNISAPVGICKYMCTLYICFEKSDEIGIFDLSALELRYINLHKG